MREFKNEKGESKFISEKNYVSSVIIMLNDKGYKEVFHNE